MALKTDILARLNISQSGSNDFSLPSFQAQLEASISLTDGVAADKADLAWADERSVASAGTDDIDLAGVLASVYGATITFAGLVALFIINRPKLRTEAQNTTNLTVGLSSAPFVGFLGGTTPTLGPIRPGGFVFLAAPPLVGIGAVTATTADLLRVVNSAGAIAKYQIGIIGRSA